MENNFDPEVLNFNMESNELAVRLAELNKAKMEISKEKNIPSEVKLKIMSNLQAECDHIKKIFDKFFETNVI